MDNLVFDSSLKEQILLHLTECKSSLSENSYTRRISQLHDFDNFLVEYGFTAGEELDEELVTEWISNHVLLSDSTIMTYVNALRRFLVFYSRLENVKVYIPPSYKVNDSYVPYYFSDEEMSRIYECADNYQSGLMNTYPYIELELPVIIRLLDACGFRISELITTNMHHVDLTNGVLTMVNTKNKRERLVPMAESVTGILKCYCKTMNLHEGTNQLLFPGKSSLEPLTRNAVGDRFRNVLLFTGIRKKRNSRNDDYYQRGPCIHCLRHRFVLRSVKKLLSHGVLIEDAIPYLSIYLGHDSISETEKYLKFASDLFPEELEKFDSATYNLYPDEEIWDDWMV